MELEFPRLKFHVFFFFWFRSDFTQEGIGLELEFQKQSSLLKCFIRMLCTKFFSKKLLFGKFCPSIYLIPINNNVVTQPNLYSSKFSESAIGLASMSCTYWSHLPSCGDRLVLEAGTHFDSHFSYGKKLIYDNGILTAFNGGIHIRSRRLWNQENYQLPSALKGGTCFGSWIRGQLGPPKNTERERREKKHR